MQYVFFPFICPFNQPTYEAPTCFRLRPYSPPNLITLLLRLQGVVRGAAVLGERVDWVFKVGVFVYYERGSSTQALTSPIRRVDLQVECIVA